jgi:hypothetical protein
MRRFRLPLVVFFGLVTLEFALLMLVDTTTRPLDRAGMPFELRNIATGTAITQRMEVAAVTSGSGPAVLDAQLAEVDADGATRGNVRRALVELAPSATTCCAIRFQPIPDSRWRAYRLDLVVGPMNGRQLSLRVVPSPVNGRLTINGQPRPVFLLFATRATAGTGVGRLRMTSPGKALSLAALALMCDAAIAAAIHLLTTASSPRRA